jgi:hypothetical protein
MRSDTFNPIASAIKSVTSNHSGPPNKVSGLTESPRTTPARVERNVSSSTPRRGSHGAAAPACSQRASFARNAGSRAVKYCAPWSLCQSRRGACSYAPAAPALVEKADLVVGLAQRSGTRQTRHAGPDDRDARTQFQSVHGALNRVPGFKIQLQRRRSLLRESGRHRAHATPRPIS